MHIAEVVTIAKSLPLLRLNTYKSLILSYSADYKEFLRKTFSKKTFESKSKDIAKYEGVYCDMLEDIFKDVTGLNTRLF